MGLYLKDELEFIVNELPSVKKLKNFGIEYNHRFMGFRNKSFRFVKYINSDFMPSHDIVYKIRINTNNVENSIISKVSDRGSYVSSNKEMKLNEIILLGDLCHELYDLITNIEGDWMHDDK